MVNRADLSVRLGDITLKNPIIPASGTFAYGEEFQQFFPLDILGAFILKGIYKNPRLGNPPPRIHETAAGLLNSIGLAGPGAEGLKEIIKKMALVTKTPIVVNVCGGSDDEYLEVSKIFDAMDEVAMLELNISCPNVSAGGKCPAMDRGHTYRLVKEIKENTKKHLMVKLSPNTHDVPTVAAAAEEAGADSISLVNTFLGMAVDLNKRAPVFKNIFAGLSGPAIKPLALKLVWETARAVSIPVVGIGGIMTGKDVLEFILVGASAVQTGTVNMVEPCASVRIINELEQAMKKLDIKNLDEIKGKLEV
ncbi:MAG: dihydroorotate dehydrogenase [bacterium]|nr:dihydroorotate dehydrogenase [bacterium]